MEENLFFLDDKIIVYIFHTTEGCFVLRNCIFLMD